MMDADEAFKPIFQLAKDSADANLPTIRTVVMKALSDPRVFTGFDEIKQVLQPKLSTLGSDGEILLRSLDLFSYGTHGDYVSAAKGSLLPLTDTQIFKLRQLTLMTLVHGSCGYGSGKTGCVMIPYATMAKELGFTDGQAAALEDTAVLRQVEGVVLECVYARVLAGQLCQKSKALFVSSRNGPPCRPRDVPLSRGAAMLEILSQFHGKLEKGKTIQSQIQQSLQMQFDSTRLYHKGVQDKTRKAEASGSGSMTSPALIMGGGGSVRGWSERQVDERRSSVKRSRGGVGGSMEAFNRC
ncbi:signalosome complex subunit 7a [Seminavis robusta]|uniref:Signalosome complex subunit 7a n=1 Tax=Seminavis robusta TaxID=568900 RepID=A0A9N8HWK9_9STRA|nr:signalosome complex subunit 7a [Seminavis robusta]|eukprot:Sro1993_g309930.1 signalosome complex subunit 7a (298) ;mRNA; f:13374-14349